MEQIWADVCLRDPKTADLKHKVQSLVLAFRRNVREDQRRAALPLGDVRPRRRGVGELCDKDTRHNAALKFLKKAIRKRGQANFVVTEKLRWNGVARKEIGSVKHQDAGRWLNNRAENSHLPDRRGERAVFRFRRLRSLQKVAAVYFVVSNHFNLERSLISRGLFKIKRTAALTEWRGLCAE